MEINFRGLIHIDEPRADDINTGDLTGFAHDRSENVVTVDQEARQAQAAGSRTVRSRPIAPRHVRDIVKDSTEKWMAANKDDDEEYFNEMQAIGYMKEGQSL